MLTGGRVLKGSAKVPFKVLKHQNRLLANEMLYIIFLSWNSHQNYHSLQIFTACKSQLRKPQSQNIIHSNVIVAISDALDYFFIQHKCTVTIRNSTNSHPTLHQTLNSLSVCADRCKNLFCLLHSHFLAEV